VRRDRSRETGVIGDESEYALPSRGGDKGQHVFSDSLPHEHHVESRKQIGVERLGHQYFILELCDGRARFERGFEKLELDGREVTFFDAGGVEQAAFDRLLTASIHIVVDASGERDRPNWSGSVERHRDMWVTGLEGEETERTWNGTGENSVLRSRHVDTLPARTYDMTGSSTIDDVVVPHPRTDAAWPQSGTITRLVHILVLENDVVIREVDRTVVVVFDGTQYATMTVNGEVFTIDLAERRLRRGQGHGQG